MKRIFCIKHFCLGLFLATVLCQTASAKIYEHSIFQPYLGAEYQFEHIKGNGDYHLLLSANFPYASIFAGTKICKYYGLEIAYYRSVKTEQDQYQFNEFGAIPTTAITAALSRTRFKGFSIDGSLYYELDPEFNVFLSVGLVTMHEYLFVSAQGDPNIAAALSSLTGRNNTVPRLGGGAELLQKNWGVRMRIFWVYTQNMKINVAGAQKAIPTITPYAYLQAVEAMAGIFYRF